MLHCAARSGAVTHFTNASDASRSACVAVLKMWKLPPPVGAPRCLSFGSMATPNGNFAFCATKVRLPVVVHIIATRPAQKSVGVAPQSTTPGGCTPSLPSATQYSNADTEPGALKNALVPSRLISSWPASIANAWYNQYVPPVAGICTPHWLVALPDRLTSFLPIAVCSAQVSG